MSIFTEAESAVKDRREKYGHPLDDFMRTAIMWSAVLEKTVTPRQVALCMAAVKISRECNQHNRDNLVDLAGYADACQQVIDAEQQEKNVNVVADTVGVVCESGKSVGAETVGKEDQRVRRVKQGS